MTSKNVRIFKELENKAKITVSTKVKEIHPVVKEIVDNLAKIDSINFIRVLPEYLQASSEVTEGRFKIPITKPEHLTAIGVYLIIDIVHKDIQFFQMT